MPLATSFFGKFRNQVRFVILRRIQELLLHCDVIMIFDKRFQPLCRVGKFRKKVKKKYNWDEIHQALLTSQFYLLVKF